ncbi:PhnD/SsuA/transferrin family substrate-binding protein [Pseudomonadota bacterium]
MRCYGFRLLPITLFFIFHSVYAQQFTFVAPPFVPQVQAQRTYQSFVGYINQVTENKFVFKSEPSWHAYLKNLRSGVYDLVFEEAHIVAWQLKSQNYKPLVRLAGSSEVIILKNNQDRNIYSLSDLAGYTVCSSPAPRLSYILLQSQFKNPHRQPIFNVVDGYSRMMQALYEHRCKAVALPLAVYALLDKKNKLAKTRIIFQSQPLPNWTFNASPRIPVSITDQLTAALLSVEGQSKTQALRNHFFSVDGLIDAQAEDYVEYASLLKNQWGFD